MKILNLGPISRQAIGGELAGGAAAALVSLSQCIGLGIIAFAPLGDSFLGYGVIAGVMGAAIVTAFSSVIGGSQGIVSGIRASVAIVCATEIAHLLPLGIEPHLAMVLALFTLFLGGLIQIGLGLCRAGNVLESMPHAILAGFVNAAALLVVIGQIKSILQIPDSESLFSNGIGFGADTLARIGIVVITVAATFVSQRFLSRIPGIIIGGIVGTAAYYVTLGTGLPLDLGGTIAEIKLHGGSLEPIVGFFGFVSEAVHTTINQGAEALRWQNFAVPREILPDILTIIIPATISVAVLQSLDTLITLSACDEHTNQNSNANRELIAQGVGTAVSCGLGYLPGSGSMIRTRPSLISGGRTAWSALFSSLLLVFMIVFMAPVVRMIPNAVVSGALFVIAYDLINKWSLTLVRKLPGSKWQDSKALYTDVLIITLVIMVALALGVVEAVGAGLAVAILAFVAQMSRSPIRRILRGDVLHSHLQRDDR